MSRNDPENGRFRRGDARLLLALAGGASIRQAAIAAKLSPKTVQRRLADPSFCEQLHAHRARMIAQALGQLGGALTAASRTLRKLLRAHSETVRLGAARSIVELHARLAETVELDARLTALEQSGKRGAA